MKTMLEKKDALMEAAIAAYDLLASKETLSTEAVEVWDKLDKALKLNGVDMELAA